MVLGFVWLLIRQYQLSKGTASTKRKKRNLFLFFSLTFFLLIEKMVEILKVKLQNYNLTINNDFSQIFNDGLIFCALLHSYDKNLIKFETLNPKNGRENITLAFRLAEQELGVTKLIDPEEFEGVVDELSVMTYLSSLLEVIAVSF